MSTDPEPIEVTRGLLARASVCLFLWGVALGYSAHMIKERIACL